MSLCWSILLYSFHPILVAGARERRQGKQYNWNGEGKKKETRKERAHQREHHSDYTGRSFPADHHQLPHQLSPRAVVDPRLPSYTLDDQFGEATTRLISMTMVIENQSRQYGGMGFDNVFPNSMPPQSQPQFTHPWLTNSSSHSNPPLYSTSLGGNQLALNAVKQEDVARPTAISMPFSGIPVPATPSLIAGSSYSTAGYGGSEMMAIPSEIPRTSFDQSVSYATAPSINGFTPANYASLGYAQSLPRPQPQQDGRRISQNSETRLAPSQPTVTYADAHALSSQDLTPRSIYAPRSSRGSGDSYGFPSHSSTSSISSAGNYPYYSASVASVDSSVTDYSSTTSESYDGISSRTLPRPSGLIPGGAPPGPQSMMGQFSSKMPSNTQKKHKCKVCDKRFTRPSSLQTHMYSHTGEKPYACDVDGCGRHFSVVSNLRRHKKVHKGEKDTGSGEEEE